MASIASAILSGVGGLASGIAGGIESGQKLALEKQRMEQVNQQFQKQLDFMAGKLQSENKLKQQSLEQAGNQFNARLDWSRTANSLAWERQQQLRTENLDYINEAAKEAGVPKWMVLSGRVPQITRQMAGTNFTTIPAGANPNVFDQSIIGQMAD